MNGSAEVICPWQAPPFRMEQIKQRNPLSGELLIKYETLPTVFKNGNYIKKEKNHFLRKNESIGWVKKKSNLSMRSHSFIKAASNHKTFLDLSLPLHFGRLNLLYVLTPTTVDRYFTSRCAHIHTFRVWIPKLPRAPTHPFSVRLTHKTSRFSGPATTNRCNIWNVKLKNYKISPKFSFFP